jgi:competence protein ComEC
MVLWGSRLQSQVFKIPHHGAKNLDKGFIHMIKPQYAVISCGLNNRFGHPDSTTVTALEQAGANIHRTDREGTIVFTFPDHEVLQY